MPRKIFRDAALERLSSPEQLDYIIKTTDGHIWAGLLALMLLAALGLAWAFAGSLPTIRNGAGMIVRSGGVLNIVSRGSGVVLSIDAKVGQHVKAGQVVAKVAQPDLVLKVRELKQALDEVSRGQDLSLALRENQGRLQKESLNKQRANAEEQIKNLQNQLKLAQEQVPVLDQLLTKGLVTRQQTIDARQKVIGFETQIASVQALLTQLDAQEYQLGVQIEDIKAQNELKVGEMRRNIVIAQSQLNLVESVGSPYSGEIFEVKVYSGSTVSPGAALISIQPDADALETVVYVAAADAKDISPGMECKIAPSIVKPEEFGYMMGLVTYVGSYPSTPAALMRNFQNESVIASFSKGGPVTEVRIAMTADTSTFSGFRWSSSQGPPIKISAGTLCAAKITTQTQAPITLLLPALKGKYGVK